MKKKKNKVATLLTMKQMKRTNTKREHVDKIGGDDRRARLMEVKDILIPQHAVRSEYNKDKMSELQDSIKKLGILEPILVKAVKKGFEIVAGHRRYKAAKLNGLTQVPVIIIDDAKGQAEIMKLHENIVREDVNVYDEAMFLKTVMKKERWSQQQLAKEIGRSTGYVSERINIMLWPDCLQKALQDGKINVSVARQLSRIDDEKVLKEYAKHAIESGITPALAEVWATEWIKATKGDDAIKTRKKDDVGAVGSYKVMVVCVACQGQFSIEDTGTYRLDNECAKAAGLLK